MFILDSGAWCIHTATFVDLKYDSNDTIVVILRTTTC